MARRTFKQVAQEAAAEARFHAIAECCRWLKYDAPKDALLPEELAEMLWRWRESGKRASERPWQGIGPRVIDFVPQPPPDRWLSEEDQA